MRGARLLLAVVAALAVSACARQQQAYYVIDPATGQPVPVVTQPQYAQPQYAQPQYAQQSYQQPAPPPPAASSRARGLLTACAANLRRSRNTSSSRNTRRRPITQPRPISRRWRNRQPSASGGRGLFTSPASAAPQVYTRSHVQQPYARAPQGGPYVAAPYGYASAPAGYDQAYTLDSGDKLRIVVFGQDGITNSYTVDAGGNVNLPLVGIVPARGFSTQQLSQMIAERLKQGYVREPHVSVEVEAYRPFFILGEVTNPGQYPYVANMTAETAIAIAGGFAPRANKNTVELTRNAPGQQIHGDVPLGYPLRPGDTIVVKERWF